MSSGPSDVRRSAAALVFLGAVAPSPAFAHSFGRLYVPPMPFELYFYGSAAALLLSFLMIAYLRGTAPADTERPSRELLRFDCSRSRSARLLVRGVRCLAVAALAFVVVSGLVGTHNAYYNPGTTLFWVLFVLGLFYASAIVGDLYELLNPWRTIVEAVESSGGRSFAGRAKRGSSYSIALALYVVFLWIELFGGAKPRILSIVLIVYSLANLAGAWWLGKDSWFRRGELFGVLFGLVSRCAPIHLVREGGAWSVRRRPVLAGLRENPVRAPTLLLFILTMLASTAFDGLHETSFWTRGFWVDVYGLLTPYVGTNIVETYWLFRPLFSVYQTIGLVLAPVFYWAIYAALLAIAKGLTRSEVALADLTLRFALTLVPIAFFYHLAHYFSFLLTQGYRWATGGSNPPLALDVGFVWHAQVGFILVGHVASVYLAHLEALRIFPTRRRALVSQLPMLTLMIVYTVLGLWILAQPIAFTQV